MRKKPSKWPNLFLLILFVSINILNLLDIYTTKVFTKDYTDLEYESNKWMVYNAEGGYLWEFHYFKITHILLESAVFCLLASLMKKKQIRLFAIGWLIGLFARYVFLVANNTIAIIKVMGLAALF